MKVSCRRPKILLGAVLVGASVTLACSGGDAAGGAPLNGSCLDLAGSAPTQEAVSLAKGTSSCDMLAVDVVVTDVTDVFASSFTLNYDDSLARYEGSYVGRSRSA